MRDDLQRRIRAPAELGPDVDLEMRALLDADHRAEHHHPDEQEARKLLGPDVTRDQRGVAREHLQRNRNDQYRDSRDHQPGQQPAVSVDQSSHEWGAYRTMACGAARRPRRAKTKLLDRVDLLEDLLRADL